RESCVLFFFFFQAEDGIRDFHVTGVQTCALPIFGIDVGASVERARRRNQARANPDSSDENRFERESRAFFSRVRSCYLEIAKREAERVVVVDARGTPDHTHAKILEIVNTKLGSLDSSVRARNVG